ncbi:sporulation protein YqfD [Mycoplasmatota bacterium]|nr:sporulation protein YqfD [Mycoplasmatota bacterium]
MKNNNKFLFSVIIKIPKKTLIKINQLFSYKVKIIKKKHDFFYLQVQENDLNILNKYKVDYEIISYKGIKHIYRLLLTHLSVFIGIILFLLILYANTLTIKEISFSTYTKDNEKIKSIIERHYTSFLDVHLLNSDINDINLLLRKEFNHFEWISIERSGCLLKVTILEPSVINKQVEHIEGYGDLVAKTDGMVKFFQITQGIPLIEQNQYVKKGEVLVSGNLRYHNQDESEFYIPAYGHVYAEVWYTKTIVVPKKSVTTEFTGKISLEKKLSLFGLDIKYKSSQNHYKEYHKEENFDQLQIFSFKLPIGIKKIHYLEKNDIMNVYDNKSALQFASSQIRYELSQSFREGDKILEVQCLNESEDDLNYTYVFFVRTYEDIAIFQRRAMNE